MIINELIKLMEEVAAIVGKSLNFNEKQKDMELKILTPKQVLQRLTIALAQVKAGVKSENLLNEIFQIYMLCIGQNKLLKTYTTI